MTFKSGTTETRLGPQGPVVALAYRRTGPQRLELALFIGVLVGVESAIISGVHAGYWQAPIFATLGAAIGMLVPRSAGTVITPDGVTVRRFGRHTIAWSDVESITLKCSRGGSTHISLRETNGKKTPLPGIVSGVLARDPAFKSKYTTITQWWTAARTPDGPATATA